MKKITLLISENQREETLANLRRMGTVHIRNVVKPFCEDLRSAEEEISQVRNAISVLCQHKEHCAEEKISWQPWQIPHKTKEINIAAREKDETLRLMHEVEQQLAWFKQWGEFNPEDIQNLKEKGIYIRLYRAPRSSFRKLIDKTGMRVISEDKNYFYLAQVSQYPETHLDFEEIKPPKEGAAALNYKREHLHRRLARIEYLLDVESRAVDSLKEFLRALESKQQFLNVKYGMKEEINFAYLQGFCPREQINSVIALAKSQKFGYLIEEPSGEDEVPTLIRNPKLIRIINPVFKFMNTIPGYSEYDISFWFLLFFSLFFAMLIGDAGYGIIFLSATFIVRSKLKKVPDESFILIYMLSIATIIWGAITGTWFGAEKIAQLPFFKTLVIERLNSFVDANQSFMMYFCFIIGVVHLSIAHLIRAVRIINSLKVLAEIGWVFVLWGLFFTATKLIINHPFPEFAQYLLIFGALLVFLFANFQKNMIKGALVTLIDLPLKIMSSFGDIVSYLRLFAIGYATLALASTFNKMTFELGKTSILAGFIAALILFMGHALNIVLGLLSVIVHGIRLNMLEFSGQLGMEWLGKEYSPFRE